MTPSSSGSASRRPTPKKPSMRPSEPSADLLAANVTATMITGPIVFALIGWLLDRWLDTKPVLVLIGLLSGMALALYTVWIRYGTGGAPAAATDRTADRDDQGDAP